MTPEERQLIAGLFDRMRSFGAPDKDREAETLINQAVRAQPDAPYMLVQSVLVQEHALQEAGNRIQDLEEQVRALQGGGQARSQGSGSFLGGLFGGGARTEPPPARAGSVPVIGSRATPSATGSPWSQGQGAAPPPASPPAAGGGFMKSAMATAAGVAGGMLLADGIRNMMGGSHAGAGQAQASPLAGPSGGDKGAQGGNNQEPLNDQADQHDRSTYDEPASGSGWDSGDIGGGDIEI